ncbi:hypothetical protein AVEN_86528-1 [Araneus ventricosus]|uniref:Uncharacterized protein n=1 Tax=Araneus ventricosus TaxID=182803 RepID=A0A4Y2VLQ9_ARAVE|nr:hypothetical protein AVEN_86528-1 [Araneus ventricosus]
MDTITYEAKYNGNIADNLAKEGTIMPQAYCRTLRACNELYPEEGLCYVLGGILQFIHDIMVKAHEGATMLLRGLGKTKQFWLASHRS